MTELSKNELVESAIGKTGGYKLKRAPRITRSVKSYMPPRASLLPYLVLQKTEKSVTGEIPDYTYPFWLGLEEHIKEYVNSYTLKDVLELKNKQKNSCCKCDSHNENEDDVI